MSDDDVLRPDLSNMEDFCFPELAFAKKARKRKNRSTAPITMANVTGVISTLPVETVLDTSFKFRGFTAVGPVLTLPFNTMVSDVSICTFADSSAFATGFIIL